MRAVIQRVSSAQVSVKNKTVGKIAQGYFILLGITHSDNLETAKALATKISKIRLMPDENSKMNLDLKTANASCLVVSQFTLYANTQNGNRPSFIDSAPSDFAKPLYQEFIFRLRESGILVETGQFGEHMDIQTKLDGPVTIILEQ